MLCSHRLLLEAVNSQTVIEGCYRQYNQTNIPPLLLLHFYNFAEFRTNQLKFNHLTPNSNMYKAGKGLQNPAMILWFMVLNDSLCRHQYFELFVCHYSRPTLNNVPWQYSGWVSIKCTSFEKLWKSDFEGEGGKGRISTAGCFLSTS